jgi:hypothetical protein
MHVVKRASMRSNLNLEQVSGIIGGERGINSLMQATEFPQVSIKINLDAMASKSAE